MEEDRQSLDRLMSVEAPESESSNPLTAGMEELQMEMEAETGMEAQQREAHDE